MTTTFSLLALSLFSHSCKRLPRLPHPLLLTAFKLLLLVTSYRLFLSAALHLAPKRSSAVVLPVSPRAPPHPENEPRCKQVALAVTQRSVLAPVHALPHLHSLGHPFECTLVEMSFRWFILWDTFLLLCPDEFLGTFTHWSLPVMFGFLVAAASWCAGNPGCSLLNNDALETRSNKTFFYLSSHLSAVIHIGCHFLYLSLSLLLTTLILSVDKHKMQT